MREQAHQKKPKKNSLSKSKRHNKLMTENRKENTVRT